MFYTPRILLNVPIFKRLIPSILKRYARIFHNRFVVEKRSGVNMLLDQRNSVDRNLLIKGVWEPEQVACLTDLAKNFCSKGGVQRLFLDIGAHWGLYAILMQKTGLFDRIIAIEPEPVNFSQLSANLFVNELIGSVEAIQTALSDHDDTLSIVSGPASNRGGTRVVQGNPATAGEGVSVACARLDSLINIEQGHLVIKMDVEGHEFSVIAGMIKLLQSNLCILQIESFGEGAKNLQNALGPQYIWLRTIGDDHYFTNTQIRL